ncbi:unnamed protein product [Rotaria sordida]|uniref:Uncharacterized protein n=1 Tax=Rotaria sordida TaxID=392033 RepID=A0A814EBT1_9BILA|nr:unnamed protein product [Rotaria sordida]
MFDIVNYGSSLHLCRRFEKIINGSADPSNDDAILSAENLILQISSHREVMSWDVIILQWHMRLKDNHVLTKFFNYQISVISKTSLVYFANIERNISLVSRLIYSQSLIYDINIK